LILGGILPTLPVFGLWMLPLGFALIADDVPWLKCRLRKRYGSQSDLCHKHDGKGGCTKFYLLPKLKHACLLVDRQGGAGAYALQQPC
jgi:hypothetical protein